jgi:hypothetical protein
VRSVTSQREISPSVGLLGRNLMDYHMMSESARGVAARVEKKRLDELGASDIICVIEAVSNEHSPCDERI